MWDTDPSAVLFHKISGIFFFSCSVESLAVVLSAILLVYCASIGRLFFFSAAVKTFKACSFVPAIVNEAGNN
jgi:hypothetical protein